MWDEYEDKSIFLEHLHDSIAEFVPVFFLTHPKKEAVCIELHYRGNPY